MYLSGAARTRLNSVGSLQAFRFGVCAGDAFFKAAISLLSEVPRTMEVDGKMRASEPFLLEYIANLTSTLLIVPVSAECRAPFQINSPAA